MALDPQPRAAAIPLRASVRKKRIVSARKHFRRDRDAGIAAALGCARSSRARSLDPLAPKPPIVVFRGDEPRAYRIRANVFGHSSRLLR